ncbi:MAG TPA: HNH endonuclease [Blastocatellia bacterium]|nr:HNH endonuclease [Blastocatellia bacterium]
MESSQRIISRRVLLLNASYEPLNLVSAPKALALVWRKAAEIIERDEGRVLRTARFEFDVPAVVRLVRYVDTRTRRQNRMVSRLRILIRDKHRCQYCGRRGTQFDLTLDHIIPRSRGGQSVPENLCASCKECNQRKGDRTPDEARMPLLSNPSALYYGLERAVMIQAADSRPEWRKYLCLEEIASAIA